MFLERLNELQGRIEGARAISIVASDGMPVESLSEDPTLDLESLAAELVAQARVVSEDHEELHVGRLQHLSVEAGRAVLMLTSITDNYYLLLVLDRRESIGRARFELRRARLQLEADLD